jgi:hypothetical protein
MDETGVHQEVPMNTTIDEIGARNVVIKSTGFSSMRITCLISVKADESNLPPILIQKGNNAGNACYRVNSIWFSFNEKSLGKRRPNKSLFRFVFPVIDADCSRRMMIWYSCKAHISKTVKGAFTINKEF